METYKDYRQMDLHKSLIYVIKGGIGNKQKKKKQDISPCLILVEVLAFVPLGIHD